MRGSLCSHQKLSTLAREWVSSEIIHMPEHFFMVKATCNECKCLGFPPRATEISLFSAFSNVTQVWRWRGQRNTLRESPYQAARRALSRTLHSNVSPLPLLELLSGFDHPCPSVTAFPSSCAFPAARARARSHQGFLCWIPRYLCARQKKNQTNPKYRHSPACSSYSLSAFTVGAVVFLDFSARRAEMLLQESQRALASCSGEWQLEGEEDVWKPRKGITWEINVTSWLRANLLENCFFETFEGKLGQSQPIGSAFPHLARIRRHDGLDSTEYLISVF